MQIYGSATEFMEQVSTAVLVNISVKERKKKNPTKTHLFNVADMQIHHCLLKIAGDKTRVFSHNSRNKIHSRNKII